MRLVKSAAYLTFLVAASLVAASCSNGTSVAPVVPGAGGQLSPPSSFGGPLERIGGASAQRVPAAGPGWLSPEAKTGAVMFVANQGNSTITIYNTAAKNGPPIGMISQGVTNPTSIAVDKQGNLYVGNSSTSSAPASVAVYASHSRTPFATYTTGIVTPTGIAVGADGTLYAANSCCASGGAGNIVAFAPGSMTPTQTFSDPNLTGTVGGLTVDAGGNLYVAYQGNGCCPPPVYVDEYLAGSPMPLTIASFPAGGYLVPPGNSALDTAGNLLLTDAQKVSVVPPAASSPSATFGQRGNPYGLAFNKSGNRLYVADNSQNEVEVYAYPSTKLVSVFQNGTRNPTGVALRPVEPPATRSPQPTPLPTLPPGNTLYLDPINGSSVVAYDAQSGTQTGSVNQGIRYPQGLAVDAAGDLFVSNAGSVQEFAPGASSPTTTFNTGGSTTNSGVAVGADGTVYVANIYGSPTVLVFGPGSTTPTASYYDSNVQYPFELAVDANNNLYVGYGYGPTGVAEFVAGSYNAASNFISVSGQPYGVAVDSSGDLIVSGGQQIEVFPPLATSPSTIIGQRAGICGAGGLALDSSEQFLYVSDQCSNSVYAFAYPNGARLATFTNGISNSLGLALSPAAPLGAPYGSIVRRHFRPQQHRVVHPRTVVR